MMLTTQPSPMLTPLKLKDSASASSRHSTFTAILGLHSFLARFLKAFAICAAFFSMLSGVKNFSGL